MKIVFLDSYTLNPGDLSWDLFMQWGDFVHYPDTSPDEIIQRAQDAEIIITNKVKLNETHFNQLHKLKLILVAATGYDVIDTVAARNHGITVCNCAGYGSRAVAQMFFAHLLEITNKVGHYTQLNINNKDWAKQTHFCYWHTPLEELDGKHIAIVGFGNIGREVARLAHAFYMKVSVVSSKPAHELPANIEKITLEDAMRKCDIVSLCCPLTKENKGMINAALLEKAQPNLIFVNTARGALIDEKAMADALTTGKVRAFCADVLATEPPSPECPLLGLPNAFITPHIAWATREARMRIITIMHNNLKAFTEGNPINVVNP